MQVTVGNQLRIENPSEQLLTWCKKQLILPNPEYAKKVRMHFWVGNTPEKLYLFQWDGDTLVLPYGDSFHQTFVEEGMAMARIRLGDKLSRFKTLSRGCEQKVNDESIRDTLIDLANYAIMTVLEMEVAEDVAN